MQIDPPIFVAVLFGAVASAWAIGAYLLSRSVVATADSKDTRTKTICLFSVGASAACLLLFSLVPDWRLIWIRWNRNDFCTLPGHSALREPFIGAALYAFLSPAFAYLGFRLAERKILALLSLLLLLLSAFIVVFVVQGLFWPSDWR